MFGCYSKNIANTSILYNQWYKNFAKNNCFGDCNNKKSLESKRLCNKIKEYVENKKATYKKTLAPKENSENTYQVANHQPNLQHFTEKLVSNSKLTVNNWNKGHENADF